MGSRVGGRYTLVREVGRGGMGAVWLARDEVLHRDVALKRVGAGVAMNEAAARVHREARVSAMLNHPHVVTVFDLVNEDDDHWLVMEYVESRNLSTIVRENGPLSPDETARLMTQAASALAAAHRAGVVHRDVKPGNMLVTPTGDLKLGDFGIARTGADVSLTQTGLVTGSPGYLAPEVAAGHSATLASDVWSLGATVFHLVTGHPPYDTSENLMGTLYRLVHEEPPRTDRAGWLTPLLLATMERDPQRRWSAAQISTWLRDPGSRTATGRPTSVRPAASPAVSAPVVQAAAAEPTGVLPASFLAPSAPTQAGERRRSPLWAAAAVAVVVALAAGGWMLGTRDGDNGGQQSATESSSDATSGSPSEPSTTATPDRASMEAFVGSYLEQASSDPAAAFEMLTPQFQDASKGLNGYRGWWDQVRDADLLSVTADPETMAVDYRVRYTMRNGKQRTQAIRLRLEYQDGAYRIAGEG